MGARRGFDPSRSGRSGARLHGVGRQGRVLWAKIDVNVRDAIGRFWQVCTIQVDFQEPDRFGLEYIDEHGERQRPVMVHRALFGSVERFFGVLVEHFAGAFPTWLAPVQVAIIPIADRHADYRAAGGRAPAAGRGPGRSRRLFGHHGGQDPAPAVTEGSLHARGGG